MFYHLLIANVSLRIRVCAYLVWPYLQAKQTESFENGIISDLEVDTVNTLNTFPLKSNIFKIIDSILNKYIHHIALTTVKSLPCLQL